MRHVFIWIIILTLSDLCAQQVPDTTYNPPIIHPPYSEGNGPVIYIDEGHHNFHTRDGRYSAFARLLERDGYVVESYKGLFSREKLESGKILVISNALNEVNVDNWFLPNPSAFTEDEIGVLKDWVLEGGRLFLIADHMPLAGAAADLGRAFGFEFTNGFVFKNNKERWAYFNMENKGLHLNEITQGRNDDEKVSEVVTFTGQAFRLPAGASPILTFNNVYVNMVPDTAWVFEKQSTSYPVPGWSQGAFMKFGTGRIVVFGEAAMFSAQLAGPQKIKMGMNNEVAPRNYQLLLNIIHWLDGLL